MKRTLALLASALLVSPLLGAGLSAKYKSWDRSPESYFMTRAERDQWKTLRTDDAAEKFIAEYKARRGPDWEKMLAGRIAAADKYFSSGKTRGSETFRGKVVIVFGPPSALSRSGGGGSADANAGVAPSIQSRPGGGKGGSGDTSVAMSSGGASPVGSAPRHAEAPTVTFGYDASAAPPAIGKAFDVEVRMISSTDQEPVDPKGFEEKVEAVAQASQAGKSSPPGSSEPVNGE